MTRYSVLCVGLVVLVYIYGTDAATRVARSPQLGFAQASAQAQGGGFSGPPFPSPPQGPRPQFGAGFGGRPGGFGGRPGGFGGRPGGFGERPGGFGGYGGDIGSGGLGQGESISISKSISISRGGVAQSNAGSSAAGK